jgi:hypothetical protein
MAFHRIHFLANETPSSKSLNHFNKKTYNSESCSIFIDRITVTQTCSSCDGSLTGTPCNDGEACTVNDIYDANCNCLGTFQDSDNDSVCDADDQCPGFDDRLIGTSCNDNNPLTINDVYTSNCTCEGILASATDFWFEAECTSVGSQLTVVNNGQASSGQAVSFTGANQIAAPAIGAAASVSFSVEAPQSGAYKIFLRSIAVGGGDDSYWVRANNDAWVRFNKVNVPGYSSAFQWDQVGNWNTGDADASPVTFNLVSGSNTIDIERREDGVILDKIYVTLTGSLPSGQGQAASNCGGPGCTPGTACNDGNPCTTGDSYNSSCNCVGTFQDADGDGVCDANDICPNFNDNLIGTACNDGDASTINDVYTNNCTCEGSPTGGGGTVTLDAIDDAYLQGSTNFNTTELRVENGNRVSYLKFNLGSVTGPVTSARLDLTVGSDAGSGSIVIQKGNSNNWTETNLSTANDPVSVGQIGSLNTSYSTNTTYSWNLSPSSISGSTISLIVVHQSGNDVSFKSSENTDVAGRPKLVVSYGSGAREGIVQSVEQHIQIAPNPFKNTVKVSWEASNFHSIQLLDMNGKIVRQEALEAGRQEAVLHVQQDNLSGGLYLIRLVGLHSTTTKKVMKAD